jgi:beta-N-acetylhexosaminidase
MKDDAEFRVRVRDAARRILTIQLRHLRGNEAVPYIPDLQEVEAGLPNPEGGAFFLNLAARSVTIVKPPPQSPGVQPEAARVFPLKAENAGKVLLTGQYLDYFKAGRAAFPGATSFWYTEENVSDLLFYARRADTIVFCLSDAAGVRVLRQLQALKKRIIILSVLSPVYLESVPWVDGAVAVYSYAFESLAAGFSVITGRIAAEGSLPYE